MGSPCLPSPLPVAPPLSPFPTPPRQMEPAPSVRPPRQHSPHLPPPYAQGLACGRCLLGDSEDWLGSDGWELSHVSLRLPQSPPGSPCLVTAALALADCPVPGLDLKSPEGSSQPCVWPLPCPMAWLWVWQASAGEAWGPQGGVWSHVCVCVCERDLGGSENSEGWEPESLWGWMGPKRRGQRMLSEPGCLCARPREWGCLGGPGTEGLWAEQVQSGGVCTGKPALSCWEAALKRQPAPGPTACFAVWG